MNKIGFFALFYLVASLTIHGMEEGDVLTATQSIWSGFYTADPKKALDAICSLDEQTVNSIKALGNDTGSTLITCAVDNCIVGQDEETAKQAIQAIKVLYDKGITLDKEGTKDVQAWKDFISDKVYSNLIEVTRSLS